MGGNLQRQHSSHNPSEWQLDVTLADHHHSIREFDEAVTQHKNAVLLVHNQSFDCVDTLEAFRKSVLVPFIALAISHLQMALLASVPPYQLLMCFLANSCLSRLSTDPAYTNWYFIEWLHAYDPVAGKRNLAMLLSIEGSTICIFRDGQRVDSGSAVDDDDDDEGLRKVRDLESHNGSGGK